MNAPSPSAGRVSTVAWERVWRHRPAPAKDDALLDRERGSARWTFIRTWLTATFGSIRGLRTVELGCGRGDLTALLAEEGAVVTLVDACPSALEQARARFARRNLPAKFEAANFLDPDFATHRLYDVALSSGVIEHFKASQRTASIRAHRAVLTDRGVAIISVPHAHCPPYRAWKWYLERRGWWPYGMERPYTKRELVRRARDAGFSQTKLTCTGLLHSVGTHWMQRLFGRRPGWTDDPCPLDHWLGSTLTLAAWPSPGVA